jgi:glutaredoxin
MIEVYTKGSCAACLFTKRYLEEQGKTYIEYVVDRDVTVEEIRKRFPQAVTVPIVVIDEQYIGGYTELSDFFERAA